MAVRPVACIMQISGSLSPWEEVVRHFTGPGDIVILTARRRDTHPGPHDRLIFHVFVARNCVKVLKRPLYRL